MKVLILVLAVSCIVFSSCFTFNEKAGHVLVVLEDVRKNETQEMFVIKAKLEAVGFTVDAATASGEWIEFYNGRGGVDSILFQDVHVDRYDALVLPSDSRKHLYIDSNSSDKELIELVINFSKTSKLIVAQRWGIVVLAESGILDGRQFSFPENPVSDSRFQNAIFTKSIKSNVIEDGNIITTSICPFANPGLEVSEILLHELKGLYIGDEEY